MRNVLIFSMYIEAEHSLKSSAKSPSLLHLNSPTPGVGWARNLSLCQG